MSKDDYRIWSNADLDYEEWKDWMEEEYPTFSEDERVAMMYEILCFAAGDQTACDLAGFNP